jgi:hypothetical protein
MYDKIKECVWDDVEPYYNTGKGLVFTFDGAEEGNFWIYSTAEQEHYDTWGAVPLDHVLEFTQFAAFCLQHIKEWQESDEGKRRIKEIENMNLQ